jgi:hypothetical protein
MRVANISLGMQFPFVFIQYAPLHQIVLCHLNGLPHRKQLVTFLAVFYYTP